MERGRLNMKSLKRWGIVFALLSLAVVVLSACGGGGGGGGGTSLSPPAFTNLAGTRWSETDTVSGTNSCNVGIGVTDSFTEHVLAQSGNTISVYDERGSSSNASNGTLSGYVFTYSGSRYPVGGCSNMTANYSVTLNSAETAYTGSATITCQDNGCTVPVSVSATKL
jgi:hypothetical protein